MSGELCLILVCVLAVLSSMVIVLTHFEAQRQRKERQP